MAAEGYKRIIWLASYPKSGNTWFRAFLANLLNKTDSPADINELAGGPIASSRQLFDEATGLSSSDMIPDEIDNLRPYVYDYIARNTTETIFHKIHDAYTLTAEGRPLVPKESTIGALYFVRNPLDVAVSFAHHSNLSFEAIVAAMNNEEYAFCSKSSRLHMQLRQKLLTWSHHYLSWTRQADFPVMVMKYEDMKLNTFESFSAAIKFCGFNYSEAEITEAIRKSSFSELQKQEKERGFREKSPDSQTFFRKGKIGTWQEELPQNLVDMIKKDHEKEMLQLGYL
jgi:hypothetical protein